MEASVNIFNNNTGRLKNEKVSITIENATKQECTQQNIPKVRRNPHTLDARLKVFGTVA